MTVEIKGFGKITASREVLNAISILASEAADSFNNRKREALGQEAHDVADAIYDALDAVGVYDRYR